MEGYCVTVDRPMAQQTHFVGFGGFLRNEYPEAQIFTSKRAALKVAKTVAGIWPDAAVYVCKGYGRDDQSFFCVQGNDHE